MGVLPRLDHVHHRCDIVDGRARVLIERGLGRILYFRVERGADEVAALVDLLSGQTGILEVLERVLAEESAVACRDAAA